MDTTKAVELFERNWFLRDVETPDLTEAERATHRGGDGAGAEALGR